MQLNKLALISILIFTVHLSCHVSSAEPARVPKNIQAAMQVLPSDAKPQVLLQAANGAIYALLPNGCEIIVMEKHSAPVAAVQAWVRTGAIHEGKWMGAGLSHFCEHLLFKGTTKRPTGILDQEVRGAGGDDNAYTNSERTVYHITCAADGFATSFNVMADMLMDSTFPPEETVKEHAVVCKEIERYMDNPEAVLFEAFERTVYQEHPYRVPVLGYSDRFKQVTRDEVFAYYQQRYSPQMCTFIAVGDFDAATVLPMMAQSLSAWKRKSVAPTAIAEEPPQVAPRTVELTHPLCEVPKMVLGFPSVALRHPDLYALDLLANILGDGRSSRLYQAVKDKEQLVLDVSAYNYTPMYPGYFAIETTVEKENLGNAKAAILKIMEEASVKRPTDDELARAKRKVFTQHVFAQMTADGLAGSLGSDWLVAGDLDFSEHYTQRMQAVSADDIVRVAKKYLVMEKLNSAVLLPQTQFEMDLKTVGADQAGIVKTKQDALKVELDKLRADPSIGKVSLLKEQAVFEFTLKPSGVRVAVREDSSIPVINIAITALGGTRWEPAELAGSGNLLAEMLDRGTAKRDKLKMAEESEGLGASLSTFSSRNSFGVSIKGLKQDLPRLMDLVSDCMLHPSFPQIELDKLKADILQEIAQEDESLFTLNSKILRPMLYGSHPYARQNLGTVDTVKRVDVNDLKTQHQAWVQAENLALSFVGDISALDALKLTRAYFGDLKPGAFAPPPVPPVPELAGEKSDQAEKTGITGAILTLGFRGVSLKSPDRETLDLLAALLSGLGGRLFIELREKQGLAYSTGVYNDSQLDGGAVVFYIQTAPQSIDKALAGMWGEVKKLREQPVPQKELESIKNYLTGTEAIELQDQSVLAQRLAQSQLFEEGAGHIFARRTRLDKVNVEQLQAAAVKYLATDKWAKAILKPK